MNIVPYVASYFLVKKYRYLVDEALCGFLLTQNH